MGRMGIDPIALAIFIATFVFGQLRFLPVKVRYAGAALGCFAIAGRVLSRGVAGPMLALVGLAVALGIYYLFRAFTAGPR